MSREREREREGPEERDACSGRTMGRRSRRGRSRRWRWPNRSSIRPIPIPFHSQKRSAHHYQKTMMMKILECWVNNTRSPLLREKRASSLMIDPNLILDGLYLSVRYSFPFCVQAVNLTLSLYFSLFLYMTLWEFWGNWKIHWADQLLNISFLPLSSFKFCLLDTYFVMGF